MIHTFVDVLPKIQFKSLISYFCKRLTELTQFVMILGSRSMLLPGSS